MSEVAARLQEAGLSPEEAARKVELFARIDKVLPSSENAHRWFVPGRIEVAGKHTDYAGGRSLLCAAERGMCVAAAPRRDSLVRVIDVVRNGAAEFDLAQPMREAPGWQNYVATVVARIARNVPGNLRGADIGIASDLPAAAGMSSSSVLVIATFRVLAELNDLYEREEFDAISKTEPLAEYLGCIENGQSYRGLEGDAGVGTFGGSEDHAAILCSRAGELARYSFVPVTFEQRVRMPSDWVFAIGMSGVRASKTGAAREHYNHASRAARAVLDVLRSATETEWPSLGVAVRDPGTIDLLRSAIQRAQHAEFSAEELQARFEQFLFESETVVPQATAAFAASDANLLGEIMERSQWAAENLLRNQIAETAALARMARQNGAIAASAFGAGFGGSVWAVVTRSSAADFLNRLRNQYAAQFPSMAPQSEFFLTNAGPGMFEL